VRNRLWGFDGLRAVAALTVLSFHVALLTGYASAGPAKPLLWELKGGVAIFFVISGALLYLPFARAIRDAAALPDWRRYAGRRVVRILPAYWVALTAVVIGPFSSAGLTANTWSYYDLSQIYNPQALFGGLNVAWSLCVEVTFYAALPVFAALVARRARGRRSPRAVQLAWIAMAGFGSLALRAAMTGSLSAPVPGAAKTLMVALPGLFDWFAIGMALAVLRAELEAGRASHCPLTVLGRRPGWCVLGAVTAFLVGVPWQHGDLFLPWYGALTHVAIGVGSGLLVLPAIVRQSSPRGAGRRRLAGAALEWVGAISYGVYLWHLPLLWLIRPIIVPDPSSATVGSLVLLWSAVVLGALALGAASWYLVEQPAQRLVRRRNNRAEQGNAPGRTQPDPMRA
jgi:peptidoglycan/LPS O-acetylase OafA/YrhL